MPFVYRAHEEWVGMIWDSSPRPRTLASPTQEVHSSSRRIGAEGNVVYTLVIQVCKNRDPVSFGLGVLVWVTFTSQPWGNFLGIYERKRDIACASTNARTLPWLVLKEVEVRDHEVPNEGGRIHSRITAQARDIMEALSEGSTRRARRRTEKRGAKYIDPPKVGAEALCGRRAEGGTKRWWWEKKSAARDRGPCQHIPI
ncbi:hypothetical protein K438DRAFT_1939759 [Mycena galopus ATCC 62051]|nr:hypothetical protein K438DRAFT_1939759 [Mycena galopus ATCC 62051]